MYLPAIVGGERHIASPPRVLLYSHDTFGLGHLRRSRAIAVNLVREIPDISVLIVTGSPVAGRFAFPAGVDHVRLPGVVKQPDGEYVSENLPLHIDETTDLRSRIIEATVDSFRPQLVIVDKEPTGFRGEMVRTLERLKHRRRARVVLGIRDVLDAPETLAEEWRRKGALQAAETLYDELWVYGLKDIYDPLKGLDVSARLRRRMHFTGYLRRENVLGDLSGGEEPEPYILVTPGGGGDGAGLIDWVLSAYETDPTLGPPAKIVYGPFLNAEARPLFDERIEALAGRVEAFSFVSNMEAMFQRASGVVAMGGYNTFCEILSFDKPAVLAPRVHPRREQLIRARSAEKLRMIRMLDRWRDGESPAVMAEAIRALADQPTPLQNQALGVLDGFEVILERARCLMGLNPVETRLAAGG